MTKSSNSINISMNSSSALVAYLRNEIRTSVNAAFSAVVTFYRKNTFILSFLLVLFMTSIYVMDVQIPWYAAIALTLATGYSIFRGFLEIMIGFMGYTGKKAMEFKEKYIAAFNAMEHQLRQGLTQSIEMQ